MDHRQVRTLGLGTIAGLLITISLAACGGDSTDSAEPDDPGTDQGREVVDEGEARYGGTLIMGVSGETDGWTPQTNTFADAGSFVAATVIEPLAIFDEDGLAIPYLADGWESNDDFTEWTVTLREGIEFHDDTPLDAEVVVENFEVALESPLVGIALAPIIDDVEATDDLEVTFTLSTPMSAFPGSVLASQPGMMVSPAMFELDYFGARTPVGTGPFEFDEWVQDDRFTATRNDDYWRTADNGDELPYLDGVEFRVLVDSGARSSALDAGDIDMMYTTRGQDISRYRQSQDMTIIEDSQSEETFVQLNQAVPPFDNINARRAVAMAVDPVTVNAVLGDGISQPVTGPWAENEPFYNPEPGYVDFDPEGAQEALELYLEETGEERLSFQLKGLTSVDDARLLQLLQQMWDEVGIRAEVVNVEQTTFITDLAFGNFEAAFFRSFSYTEPDALYVFLHSSQSNYPDGISINFTNTRSDEIDDLMDRARETGDVEQRNQIYSDLVPAINAELPYVWLFNTPYALVARSDVNGLNHARTLGFGNFEPKWWMGEVWLEQ